MRLLAAGGALDAGLGLGGGAGLLEALVSRGAAAKDLEDAEAVEVVEDDEDEDGVTWTGAEEQMGVQSRR